MSVVVGLKRNEVMRVVTIAPAWFIPLQWGWGIYGMDFSQSAGPFKTCQNLSSTLWLCGGVMWLVMLTMIGGMLVFFKKTQKGFSENG